ncbi:MAG: porin [Pseudomonadota bacterium]
MNKKLLAAAVAGVFALPAVALAQSSVTISGFVGATVDNIKFSQPAATRTTASESRMSDDSSRIIFSVREDLGGGMSALVRLDVRPNIDTGAISTAGVSYVGISTKSAGRFTAGRHNLHRYKTPWDGWPMFGQLRMRPDALVDFAGAGAVAIANASRTPNSLMWSSPNWGGFTLDIGYSFNANGTGVTEADLTAGNTARKGRAWMLNPTFTAANWSIAYSYWDSKADAPVTAAGGTAAGQLASSDQRSNQLYGYYTWGGFKLGLLWNKTRLNAAATVGAVPVGTKLSERTAFSIPIRYTTGPHNFLAHYTRARDDTATAAQDGAKMWALMYAYALSKRTNVSLAYGKITNEGVAAFNFFGNAVGSTGSANSAPLAGEDGRIISFGIRHSY